MNMSRKMILIFFLMILLIVIINTYYLSATNIARADDFTMDRFRNTANGMVRNLEQYISIMDLAMEDLTSDYEFMESFYHICQKGDSDPAATLVWQNCMSNALYHSPAASNFYRVSVFSDNGYYLSNHVDRNDSLVSMSDEAQEVISSIPYLADVDAAPFLRHIVAPHPDYFTLSRSIQVFSIVRKVTLHGVPIGYIEIAADVSELHALLSPNNPDIMVYAGFANGNVLLNSGDPNVLFCGIPLDTTLHYADPVSGTDYIVHHVQSRWLDLDIYLSQYASIRTQSVRTLVWQYIQFSAIIAALALAAVVFVSMRLTSSIRQLTNKVRTISARKLLKANNPIRVDTFVTSSNDSEIHELERHFNALMANLQTANRNELAMRDNTTTARLNALQAQINPHFVYNTLNIIAAKGMESGNEDVTNLCAQFGQMLRFSTDTRSKSVQLWEDVEHVTNYLMLLKARYEDGLEYSIDIPPETNGIRIPRLTLQPLVENSIVHGFDKDIKVRKIQIRGEIQGGIMLLEVRDNGQGFSPDVLTELQATIEKISRNPSDPLEETGHIGMINTCWRLMHYSKSHPISMELENDHGAIVRLKIPLTPDPKKN